MYNRKDSVVCTCYLCCFQNTFILFDISLKRTQKSVRPGLSPEPTKLMIILLYFQILN